MPEETGRSERIVLKGRRHFQVFDLFRRQIQVLGEFLKEIRIAVGIGLFRFIDGGS